MRQLTLLALVLYASAFVNAASPYTTPPGGSATGVPSSSQSGLVPNRAAGTGGDTVFLRDSSGRSFRGVVPYGSSFYYDRSSGGTLQRFSSAPSASVVAGSNSYYDPRTGVRVDFSKPSTAGSNPMVNPYAPSNLPQIANTQYSPLPRPISSRPEDMTREMERQINPNWTRDKADINALAKEARSKLDMQVDPDLLLPRTEDIKPVQDSNPQSAQLEERYEQIKNQTLEQIRQEQQAADEKKSRQRQDELAGVPKAIEYKSIFGSEPDTPASSSPQQDRPASPIEAKVQECFAAAQEYLKQGRYYRAADRYAFAGVLQPENATACAGQALALFGAGEYMSSAYYLSQAIQLDARIAGNKVDLAGAFKDRDVFENRMIEMSNLQQQSKSSELAFLMAYLLWQDGKTQLAQNVIQYACEVMPDNVAVKLLSEVINSPQDTSAKPSSLPATTPSDLNQKSQ